MPETNHQHAVVINKPHFEILDGLRGVAAIAVVIFHFMEIAITEPENNFIAHAYLAVDFFFCLSGFVIAYAYDDKMATIGIAQFLKRRLIRLHPLVIIGSVMGLLTFFFDPFSNLHQTYADKMYCYLLFSFSDHAGCRCVIAKGCCHLPVFRKDLISALHGTLSFYLGVL